MDDFRFEMLKMWKYSWENYLKNLNMMQDQGEKMLDLFFVQSDSVKDEAKRLIKEGIANTKEAQKSYVNVVEENLKKIEDMLSSK